MQLPSGKLFADLGMQKQQIEWIADQLDDTLAAADQMAVVQVS